MVISVKEIILDRTILKILDCLHSLPVSISSEHLCLFSTTYRDEPTAAIPSKEALGAVVDAVVAPVVPSTLMIVSLLAPARMNQKSVPSWVMPLTICWVEVAPSASGTTKTKSAPDSKPVTVEVAIVGEGIAKESVAAGKLAAVEVTAVNVGMVKPALLVAPVPI